MGEQKVSLMSGGAEMANFMKSLLNDVQALKYMLDHNWFEGDNMRIGAEQEMVMVDTDHYKPAKICMQVLGMRKSYVVIIAIFVPLWNL